MSGEDQIESGAYFREKTPEIEQKLEFMAAGMLRFPKILTDLSPDAEEQPMEFKLFEPYQQLEILDAVSHTLRLIDSNILACTVGSANMREAQVGVYSDQHQDILRGNHPTSAGGLSLQTAVFQRSNEGKFISSTSTTRVLDNLYVVKDAGGYYVKGALSQLEMAGLIADCDDHKLKYGLNMGFYNGKAELRGSFPSGVLISINQAE